MAGYYIKGLFVRLVFDENSIGTWAARYAYADEDANLVALVPLVREAGWLSLDQLWQVARWKSRRSAGRIHGNDGDCVRAVTAFALQTKSERARIEALTLLDGVGWPSASVILHFFHCERYPILDSRALSSVGKEEPNQYTFGFWWSYVEFCRALADRTGHDMRTLDRALWAYSEQNPQT